MSENNNEVVILDGENLTLEAAEHLADHHAQVGIVISPRFEASRQQIEARLNSDKAVYGVNTGFGNLATIRIGHDQLAKLQYNLIVSHAAGTGEPLPRRVVRGMMALRINSLVKGYSGIRPVVVKLLVDMLNQGVHPIVPSRGSVGASGDLAPLAHMACAMLGEGQAEYHDQILPAKIALEQAGLSPITLEAKEGLALINGTQMMLSLGILALCQAERLVQTAEIAGAMSLEALRGTSQAFHPAFGAVRPHPGQIASAEHLRALLADSPLMESHADCGKIQDAYSLRCMPPVFGAIRDAISYCRRVFEIELNAATDNPLCFPDEDLVLSGSNFHGQPLALPLDTLGLALTQLGNFAERRIYRLLYAHESGLPAFLTPEPGLNSGLMVAQYTAAALANENKVLAYPASADSIPTSAGTEDFNSMGSTAAHKLQRILDNTTRIIAIEFLCATQGLEFHLPLQPAQALRPIIADIRKVVPFVSHDRMLSGDIENLTQLILTFGK